MCRKCGEPDRRGGAVARRRRRQRMLDRDGNGVIAACPYCGVLVADRAGYLAVTLPDGTVRRLPIVRFEQDRISAGGPYALWNLVPACGPCNKARTYAEVEIPEGCAFGPVGVAS